MYTVALCNCWSSRTCGVLDFFNDWKFS